MSHEASSWAVAQDGMNSGMKLALLVIANHASGSGVTIAGRMRLATEACCRPETMTANLRKLEDDGYLRRFERRRENGSRTSDWIVLAPERADRGPMTDSNPDEQIAPTDEVMAAARKTSGEDSSPELFPRGQVRNSGGPEPLGEEASSSATTAATDAMIALAELPVEMQVDAHALLKARTKVGTKLVTPEEMLIAAWVIRTFNQKTKGDAGLGAYLTPIVGRIRERPSFDRRAHMRLVESAFRLRWWERNGNGRRPTPKVIYGNANVFEQVVADAIDEKAGRPPQDTGEETTKRFVRKGARKW